MLDTLKPKRLILRKSPRWVPKKWKPIYEEMVLISSAGKSNKEIAELYGYTETQVSNILNSPVALEKKTQIAANLSEAFQNKEQQTLQEIAVKSIERIKATIYNDEIYERAPLAILDRSMTFLKAVGKLQGERGDVKFQQNNIILSKEVQQGLLEGIQKANRVQEIHQIPSKVA